MRALDQKPYLVNWATMCMEKQKRGLGIRSLSVFNKTLMGKWSWRFVSKRNSLWKRVIVGKYGQTTPGGTKDVREGHGVGCGRLLEVAGGPQV